MELEDVKVMELTLRKSILENDVQAVLKTISGMETQETNDNFGWNKEQLAEIKETAELLAERVNQLECEDLENEENRYEEKRENRNPGNRM